MTALLLSGCLGLRVGRLPQRERTRREKALSIGHENKNNAVSFFFSVSSQCHRPAGLNLTSQRDTVWPQQVSGCWRGGKQKMRLLRVVLCTYYASIACVCVCGFSIHSPGRENHHATGSYARLTQFSCCNECNPRFYRGASRNRASKTVVAWWPIFSADLVIFDSVAAAALSRSANP